jgi:predicted CopG family antitoxin
MSRTITISDDLYARLEAEARMRGLGSIEQLLETLHESEAESLRRREVVREIDELRARLAAKYGQLPDSTELLREDRAR